MKTKQFQFLILCIIAIIATSCSKEKTEQLIPMNAQAVVSFNPSELALKGGNEMSAAFKKADFKGSFTPGVNAIIQSLSSDPTSSGINLTSTVYAYSQSEQVAFVFQLSSESKFKSLIEKMQAEGITQPIEKKESISIARIDTKSALFFNANYAIIAVNYQAEMDDSPIAQFKQAEENSILNNKGYTKLRTKNKDLNIWFNSSIFNTIKKQHNDLYFIDFSDLPNIDYSVTAAFEKGKIEFDMTYHTEDPNAKEILKHSKKISTKSTTKFLKHIPQNTFFAFNGGIHFKELMNYLESTPQYAPILKEIPQEMSELLQMIEGSITIGITSIEKPSFIVYAETNKNGFVDKALTNYSPFLNWINDKTVSIGRSLFITEGDKFICLTSEETIAMNPSTEPSSNIKSNPFAEQLFKSNLASLMVTIPQEALQTVGPQAQELEYIELYSKSFETGKCTIHFKDQKKNSLAKIFEVTSTFMN